MRLIVLAGLVSVEKTELAVMLAQYFVRRGQTVTLIDNVSRTPMPPVEAVQQVRIEDDPAPVLLSTLENLTSDVVIFAASETVPPDVLFLLLDDVQQQLPALAVQTLALIDTRTCDCFPQFRVSLESYADGVINLPVEWASVLEEIAG
ncbi:MAG: hypothetical protein CL610_20930 [Anaerolineaceae bacterium]|nr:hypothetical protein [Anaerolineaceae bacterium]